jgi:Xaa-Pro aminopeptidase
MSAAPVFSTPTLTPAPAGEIVSREAIEEYMPLVHQVVRRFLRKLPANACRDDLTAAGVFGLMDALRKNGGSQGTAFVWYARVRIRGAIVDELRQQDWLPRRARWVASNGSDNGQAGAATAVISLEDMALGEQSTALVDEEAATPADRAEAGDTRKRLEWAVSMLPDRERLIVSMHYFEGVRFKEIGALLGVSEPRISQLHARAMEKLRVCLQEDDATGRTPLRVVKTLEAPSGAGAGAAPASGLGAASAGRRQRAVLGSGRATLRGPRGARSVARMATQQAPKTSAEALRARRRGLSEALEGAPVLLAAGLPRSRNYRAWTYPFRANSHFLYFVARSLPGAFLLLENGRAELFVPPAGDDHALWHGALPSDDELKAATGVDAVLPSTELGARPGLRRALTAPPQEGATAAALGELLGRPVRVHGGEPVDEASADLALVDALLAARLRHDGAAIAQLRAAAAATAEAHAAGREASRPGVREAEVRAHMELGMARHGMSPAYAPIVTVHGEVLHHETYDGVLAPGDLLLADVGAETPEGWASDVTRVWPVGGAMSATQRAIYDVVLRAQREAIAMVRPGVRYRDVHRAARRSMTAGLVELGLLRGDPAELDERGAGELFFPHGVGHLLGLDVHDLEDLGDRAGYAPGRARSGRFGECYLRLDRDLEPGMAVTIEPGIYFVPALLDGPRAAPFADALDRAQLARFADVRGVRIEDDVLVTAAGPEVLTEAILK